MGWTVLSSVIVGLGISTVAAVGTWVVDLGTGIEPTLPAAGVASLGLLGADGVQAVAAAAGMGFRFVSTDEEFADWLTELNGRSDEDVARIFGFFMSRSAHWVALVIPAAARVFSIGRRRPIRC